MAASLFSASGNNSVESAILADEARTDDCSHVLVQLADLASLDVQQVGVAQVLRGLLPQPSLDLGARVKHLASE